MHKNQKIRVDLNYNWKPPERSERERAVSKLRRVFHEKGIKEDRFQTSFSIGLVRLDDKKIAKWNRKTQRMEFTTEGEEYKAAFLELFRQ